MSEQLFVYVEDEQMYWHNHVLMEQKGAKAIDVRALESLSWSAYGAGRFSCSAEELVELAGWNVPFVQRKLRIIERREKSDAVPPKWAHLPIVRGATGNY